MDACTISARRGGCPIPIVLSLVRWGPMMHGLRLQLDAMCTSDIGRSYFFLTTNQCLQCTRVFNAQAHEFYGPRRREYDAPIRIAQRGGCMRECTAGGALPETSLIHCSDIYPGWGDHFESIRTTYFSEDCRESYAICVYGSDQFTIQSDTWVFIWKMKLTSDLLRGCYAFR